jgi:hypothetical protein
MTYFMEVSLFGMRLWQVATSAIRVRVRGYPIHLFERALSLAPIAVLPTGNVMISFPH